MSEAQMWPSFRFMLRCPGSELAEGHDLRHSRVLGDFVGFRFRRSLRIAPGLRLNFSKSGVSTSIGGRGTTFNIGPRGNRTTVGIPGTGLFWTATQNRQPRASPTTLLQSSSPGPPSSSGVQGCGWAAALIAVLALIGMCSPKQPGQTASTGTPSTEQASVAYVNVRSANCRAGPKATAQVIRGLSRGASVTVAEESGGWSRVTGRDIECWVSSPLLSARATDFKLPAASSPAPETAAAGTARLYAATSSARRSTPRRKRRSGSYFDQGCPCSGSHVCIGPRGGRYCITSGGKKRYGV